MAADIVIKGKNVFTANNLESQELAVAIKGNLIEGVIPIDKADDYIDAHTKVIDAGDKLVIPAFNDAHTHFISVGIDLDTDYTFNIGDCVNKEDAIKKIDEFAKSHPENKWIHVMGWLSDKWEEMPTKEDLDAILPDRPCHVGSWDMHTCWANSAALKLAGFYDGMPSPEGSEICLDENGKLTGIVKEDALNAIRGLSVSNANLNLAIEKVCDYALQCGIGTVSNMTPNYGMADETVYEAFKNAEKAGKLKVRVNFYPKLTDNLEIANKLRLEGSSDKLRIAGVKLVIDGVCEMHTGFLSEEYADEPGNYGTQLFTQEELNNLVLQADANDYSIRLHAIGNGAVKEALDAYENARKKNGFKQLNHCIEHIETCRPEDLERFNKLGVVASMQPIHSVLSVDAYPSILGEKWVPYMWPVNSLEKNNAMLAFGTDAPVFDLNPMFGLYAAVTRKQPWDHMPEDGFVKEQSISLAKAIQAYTYGSAVSENLDYEIGTLTTGKIADVVIMDRNLFAVEPEEILDSKVLYTILGGKIVYEGKEN